MGRRRLHSGSSAALEFTCEVGADRSAQCPLSDRPALYPFRTGLGAGVVHGPLQNFVGRETSGDEQTDFPTPFGHLHIAAWIIDPSSVNFLR